MCPKRVRPPSCRRLCKKGLFAFSDRAFALEPRIGFHFTVKVVSRGFLIWPWWPFFQSLQRAIERQVADRKRPDQYTSFH